MDIAFLCGGEGTRLRPLTYAVPKPMLPIGPKPILEINIDKARSLGFKRIFLMVNYKSEVIQDYFGDGRSFGISITYFEEKERRGTAGPLTMLMDEVSDSFVVMNADILTDLDLMQFLAIHARSKAELTVALKRLRMKVPYGVAEIGNDGLMESMIEKPDLEYLINAGIYAVSPSLLEQIPPSGLYHMTDLIRDSRKANRTIIGYPFDDAWRDIGRLDDYIKAFNGSKDDTTMESFGFGL